MKKELDSHLYPAGMCLHSSNKGIHASQSSSSSEEGAGRNCRSGSLGVLPSLCRDRGGGRGQQTGVEVGGRGRRQRQGQGQWTGARVESKGQGQGSVFLRNSNGSGDSWEEPQCLCDNMCHPCKQTLGLLLSRHRTASQPRSLKLLHITSALGGQRAP